MFRLFATGRFLGLTRGSEYYVVDYPYINNSLVLVVNWDAQYDRLYLKNREIGLEACLQQLIKNQTIFKKIKLI